MKKRASRKSQFLRLSALATALLFAQQSMAIGTAAGTQIDNTATLGYSVNSIDQTDISATASFVVDRRVDFTLTQLGGALVPVTPGETDAFFDLLLTNDANSPLDFSVALSELVGGNVRGVPDTTNMQAVDYAVSSASVANGDADPARLGPQFVDELAADDSIRIRVFGDTALAILNGDVAGVQLDATAGEPGAATVEGAALAVVADTALGIENVFADTDNDGVESNVDGFTVVTAALLVSKTYAIVAGDLGSGMPIPGATVEYTITVVNSGAVAADSVVIDDAIDSDVSLDLNIAAYGGNDVSVVNGATTLACDVEVNGSGDGCDLVGAAMTVGAADLVGGISVAGGSTLTILYQVTIPDPDPTP